MTDTQASVRCKFYAWWPRIDNEIEHWVAACTSCQKIRPKETDVPLFSWNVPSEAWSRIHIDFAGPFEGSTWLIIIDAYTKWLEVVRMKTTSAQATIGKLREVFARYGVPRIIVSDNGPQFISEEFRNFCKSYAIHHVTSKTNGLAERAALCALLKKECWLQRTRFQTSICDYKNF